MVSVDFEGKDLEEAIGRAAEALSLPPEKVKFNLISMGTKGFLGLGRRKAKIAVDPEDPALADDEEGPAREKAPMVKPAGERQASRKKADNQAALNDARPNAAELAPKPLREPRPIKEKGGRDNKAGPAETPVKTVPLDWAHVPPPLTRPGPGEVLLSAEADPVAELAVSVLEGILPRWGFTAAISRARLGSRIILTLDGGEDNALLIGARGATLEALQLLTGKIVTRRLKEAEPALEADCRVVLDVADYRARRQEQFLETLKRAAEQARQSHKPQTMPGLNSAERRLAQTALRPFNDLAVRCGGHREALIISSVGGRPRRTRGGARRRS